MSMHFTKRHRYAFFASIFLCNVVGCSDLDTVRNAPLDRGISRSFDVPYDRLTAATLAALSSVNVNLVSSSEDTTGTTYIIDKSMEIGFFGGSWGEVGRIFIKKTGAPPTTMIVDWEKRAHGSVGVGSEEFSRAFFDAVNKLL
jgi:hypothetical protein